MEDELLKAGIRSALAEARIGLREGGVPIGAALFHGGKLVASGRNRRVQDGSQIHHGEMNCIENAGRSCDLRNAVLFTTLSPCMMCSGTIVQFGVPTVVIGDAVNFGGNEDFLRSRGVEVVVANDPDCVAMMRGFIRDNPELWNEDIGV